MGRQVADKQVLDFHTLVEVAGNLASFDNPVRAHSYCKSPPQAADKLADLAGRA